jgi:hypothetical protein
MDYKNILYTVKLLEEVRKLKGCGESGVLETVPTCHEKAGLQVAYFDGVVYARCRACGDLKVKFAIKEA